jgi:hypothetical protein
MVSRLRVLQGPAGPAETTRLLIAPRAIAPSSQVIGTSLIGESAYLIGGIEHRWYRTMSNDIDRLPDDIADEPIARSDTPIYKFPDGPMT